MSNWGAPIAQAPAELKPDTPEWIAERDRLLSVWEAAKDTLARAKESEMEARTAVTKFAFPTPKEGMNNLPLNNGYTLKMGHKLNYNITAPNAKIEEAEDAAEKIGNEGAFLFERAITWEPKFSLSEYRKIEEGAKEGLPTHTKVKALVDSLLEIKPGAPSLEIKEPKKKL